MEIRNSGNVFEGAARVKKVLAIGATALIAGVALASPVWAGVAEGRLLEVDYSDNFVLLEGYPADTQVTVEVLRNGVTVGSTTQNTSAAVLNNPDTAVDESDPGGSLEINHAGAGEPGVNDCWQGDQTPDISPGDRVRVTGTGIDDFTLVRNLDYEDVNGRLVGVATGNEDANGNFVNSPISVGTDPEVDGAAMTASRDNRNRTAVQPSPTSGAFDIPLAGQGGEVKLELLNVSADGGEELTVASPAGPAPQALEGCPALGPAAPALADNTPPDAPSVPDLDGSSDTGPSNTDNLTLDTTPTFTGTSEGRSTVEILVDGVAVGSGQANGGKYNITATQALAPGAHDVTAQARDAAGNPSSQSAALSITIEAPPVVVPPPVVTPPPASGGPIVGTAGNDVLRGTSGNDVINGLGGNDTIIGGGGNDRINGGAGNDTLRGGAGVDTIVGGAGVDKLYGDSGNDRLNGRDGKPRDLLNGGSGRDTASRDAGDTVRLVP